MKCGPCGTTPLRLDQQVSVRRLRPGLTPDSSGHVDETSEANWIEYGRFWCEIKTKGSREFFRGQEMAADITHQITIRHGSKSAGITTDMQVILRDRVLSIAEPPRNIDESNEWLVFAAKEIK